MTTTTRTKALSLADAVLGDETYDAMAERAHGAGAAIKEADDTIASARESLAAMLPLALVYCFTTKATGAATDKQAAEWVGLKQDMTAIYAIAGALFAHGTMSAEQARADAVAAVNVSKASKPVLWAAAVESVKAFRHAVKEADAAREAKQAAKQAEQAEHETTTVTGDGDTTDVPTTVEQTPEGRGHALVVALSGPSAALVKGLESGEATLTPDDIKALTTVLANVMRAAGIGRVTTPKQATPKQTEAAA